jgi:4-amino-4-deoxy-L-arabinose transferase-like glycosyltransferase
MTGNAIIDAVSGNTGLLQAVIIIAILGFSGAQLIALTAREDADKQFELRLFLAALGLRFLASLAIYELGFVDVIKDEDGTAWLTGALVYQDWVRRDLSIFNLPYEWTRAFLETLGTLGYPYLVGTVFYLTDLPARLPAAAINNVCGAATAVVVYRAAALHFSRWVAVRAAWWTCVMPSLIVWSAQTLKEPVVIFFEALSIYSCLRLRKRGFSVTGVLLCIFPLLLLVAFRAYAAYIAGAVVIVSLLIPRIEKRHCTSMSGLAVAGILALTLLGTGMLAEHLTSMEEFDLTRIQQIRDYTARNTGSGVPLDYDLKTPSGFAMSVFVGGTNLLLAPFPWQLGGASLRMMLTVPDVVIWWLLMFGGCLQGLAWSLRRRPYEMMPILLFLTAMSVLYSITFSNVGLAYRYRATLMPWLLIFAMVGFERRGLKRRLAKESEAEHIASLQIRPIGTYAP